MHRLVDDEPPRLGEPRGRHGRKHEHSGGGIRRRERGPREWGEAADAVATLGADLRARRRRPAPASLRRRPKARPRGARRCPWRSPSARRRAPADRRRGRGRRGSAAISAGPTGRPNSSGSTACGATITSSSRPRMPAHEAPDMLAVGDHGVRIAVDATDERAGRPVRRRAGLLPHRCPQHERPPGGPRAGVGGRQHRPAGERGDHGVVVRRRRRTLRAVRRSAGPETARGRSAHRGR